MLWILATPFLPEVTTRIKSSFAFGGIAALNAYEIYILITPDPIEAPEIHSMPVFAYELVLAVSLGHPLAFKSHAEPTDLLEDHCSPIPSYQSDWTYSRNSCPRQLQTVPS